MSAYDQLVDAVRFVQQQTSLRPQAAIVLGSGLGEFAARLAGAVSIPYDRIPHWPASKVVGHEGRLVIGNVAGRTIAALSGRAHFYEGHDLARLGLRAMLAGTLANFITATIAGFLL